MLDRRPRILVIDDERVITLIIGKTLLQEGYEVVTANDFNEAKSRMDDYDLDLILTDIILGRETGIDVLREANKRGLTCPVIFITGYPNVETASEAVRLGAYDYLPKPVKNETLIPAVEKALQHKLLTDEKTRSRSNLETTFKSIKDGIITVDKDLVVLEINEAARKICGLQGSGEAKGKQFESLLNGCNRKCLDALKKTINTRLPSEISSFECDNKHHQHKCVISVATYPILDDMRNFNGCVMVVRDETREAEPKSNVHKHHQFHNIVGKSDKLKRIYSFIDALAGTQTSVLITGESGTGKGMVAEALHYHKGEDKKPFVVVNCAALSDNLLESELFGHVKGAYTGAISDRVGRFQMADGGTIFLDEIGDISNAMQLRLLRVLQDMEFERLGDSTSIKVNVRVIAATNQDLRKKVRLGKFRDDLYHRLKVVELNMPSLRDRREDIPLLVNHFLAMLNKKFGKNIKSLSEDVQKIFADYPWPGNVRELEHTLEYAFVACNKPVITLEDLPSSLQDISATIPKPAGRRKRSDREAVLQALEKTGWNRSKAARLLGINRRTVYLKIKEYSLSESETL